MFGRDWKTSDRAFSVILEKDVKVKMRDGVRLSANVFRPKSEKKFPAILGFHPYNSNQSPPIKPKATSTSAGGWAPGVERPNSWMEAGDSEFYARRGYVHVVCNARGTDLSEGVYDFIGPNEMNDLYDVIEWIAVQPWCDGNVGMFGVSYFAEIQHFAASANPPHLKCIFAPYGATDLYRDRSYHGGIFSLWPLGVRKLLDNVRTRSETFNTLGEKKFNEAIKSALENEELTSSPRIVDVLTNPLRGDNQLAADYLLHPLEDEFWHQRQVKYEKIKVPAYLGSDWGIYALHLPGAFRSWENINAPKKMTVGPPVNIDRPVYQYAYESLRWFDYWLKSFDTGIMKDPKVRVFVMGTNEWKESEDWPLPETRWTPFYLHENHLLSEHEFWQNEEFDVYEDSPWGRGSVTYYSPPMVENTEVIGPIALNLYASTTDDDILFFASLRDVDPDGKERILTRGWLRGSHREIDLKRSKPWRPYHPHTKSTLLTPGEKYEFNVEILPTANCFKIGHRIAVKISSTDDAPTNTFESMASAHIHRARPSRVAIYHDESHPSNILLPITAGNVIGTFMSGGNLPKI